jgi:putative ABC transport system ATP-binding protein
METPLVDVRDLRKTYHIGEIEVPAVRGVSLQIRLGEFVAIMGASGSGKSTFMHLIGCLDRPDHGDYLLRGRDISRLSRRELAVIRNQQIGFVFQAFNLLPRTTVIDNVALPLTYQGVSRRERRRRAVELLHVFGLGDRLHHHPNQLSGGQQQRVALARALITSPLLLLADEPTGNLDSRTSMEIMSLIQSLNRASELTTILVTHERDIAAFAGRHIIFRDGLIDRDEANPNVFRGAEVISVGAA